MNKTTSEAVKDINAMLLHQGGWSGHLIFHSYKANVGRAYGPRMQ